MVVPALSCVTERLTPRTLDLEVRGSSLVRRVVSLDKELYSNFSLFTLHSFSLFSLCMRSVSVYCLSLLKEHASVTDRNATLLKIRSVAYYWLLSLTTCPFFAYKRGHFPATKSLSFARNPTSTNC